MNKESKLNLQRCIDELYSMQLTLTESGKSTDLAFLDECDESTTAIIDSIRSLEQSQTKDAEYKSAADEIRVVSVQAYKFHQKILDLIRVAERR